MALTIGTSTMGTGSEIKAHRKIQYAMGIVQIRTILLNLLKNIGLLRGSV